MLKLRTLSFCILGFVQPYIALGADSTYIDISHSSLSGDFGTDSTTDVNALTVEIGRNIDSFHFSLAVPYYKIQTTDTADSSGLGDVIVKAGASHALSNSDVYLYPSIAIKLPTADETKSLGSGEMDIGLYLFASKPCQTLICGMGIGYVMNGDTPDLNYNDTYLISLNAFKQFGMLGATLNLQYESALVDGEDAPLKLGAELFYLFDLNNSLYGNVYTGLNDGAPDNTTRLGYVHWF